MATILDLKVAQFFRTTLTTSISAGTGTTEIQVASVDGFPLPTGSEYFYLTLVDGDTAETVKIESVNPGTNTLTTFAGDVVELGFEKGVTRAELWFTAEAFDDIQQAIEAIDGGGGGGIPPDENSITNDGGVLKVKPWGGDPLAGIQSTHIQDAAIGNLKIAANAVHEIQIQNAAVTNQKIAAVDAGKITTGDIARLRMTSGTGLGRSSVSTTSAALSFLHIAYSVVGGAPTGGVDGDIAIEWEDL
jgi:hypothetical protein